MAADGINYKDAVVITKVKLDEDGNAYLDLPFPTYCQEIVIDGQVCLYPPATKDGQDVVANVHYKVADEEAVKSFPGYVADYHNDPRVRAHWNVQTKPGELKAFCCSAAQLDTANMEILLEKQPELAAELCIAVVGEEVVQDKFALAEKEAFKEIAVEPIQEMEIQK